MKPLNYFEQIVRMPNKADKYDLRLRMIKHAITYGVKPIARVFVTTAKTVRKWLNRYRQERPVGLGPPLPLRRQGPLTRITRQRLGWLPDRNDNYSQAHIDSTALLC
jgi:transposase-like protein